MLQRMVLSDQQQNARMTEARQQTVAVCVEQYAKHLFLTGLKKPPTTKPKPNNNKQLTPSYPLPTPAVSYFHVTMMEGAEAEKKSTVIC